jgi:hypothetical protein
MCMSYHSEYLTALNIMTVGQLASSAAKYHIQIMLRPSPKSSNQILLAKICPYWS